MFIIFPRCVTFGFVLCEARQDHKWLWKFDPKAMEQSCWLHIVCLRSSMRLASDGIIFRPSWCWFACPLLKVLGWSLLGWVSKSMKSLSHGFPIRFQIVEFWGDDQHHPLTEAWLSLVKLASWELGPLAEGVFQMFLPVSLRSWVVLYCSIGLANSSKLCFTWVPQDAFSFTGLAVGHYVAGFLADLKGRRLPIVLGYLGISLLCLFMTMSSGYKSMVFLRILHGIACGIGVPPAMSMIAEIMPNDWRPFMFIIFWSFTAVGETYGAAGLVIFMPELKEDAWKQVHRNLYAQNPVGIKFPMRDQIYQIVKSWNKKGHDQEDHEDCEDREDHDDRLIKDHEKQRGWTPVVEILVQVVLWSAFPAFAMLCLCQSWLECIALFCHTFSLGLCDNVSISHFIIDHRKYIFVHANFD